MFTLIKREIEDHSVYFLGSVILSAFLCVSVILIYSYELEGNMQAGVSSLFSVIFITIALIGMCAMGASQMYNDRNNRISAFLTSLPASRNQILASRIIAGILANLIFLLPIAVTYSIMSHRLNLPYPIYPYYSIEIFTTVFLMALAIYCIGLQLGLASNKITPTLGGLVLSILFLSLIIIKGFGIESSIILLVFIISSIVYTWEKFKKTPLI